ncbi:translation machinery-associated protein 7 [Capsicum annuum]|uniref:translation machinery-associated protein 7 n=1 Tax=Capsicum annuum TaxID=4072 RepID=UPI001FB08352|nr:translation machinery-associated protein 7 [Capsicum annuum]
MSSKQSGKAKPSKAPNSEKKNYDETDKAFLAKKKEDEKALKELKLRHDNHVLAFQIGD